MTVEYRGYKIDFNPPPIGDRNHDWQFYHQDYDGPEDQRCGSSPSLSEAQSCIDEIILDEVLDKINDSGDET